MATACFVGSKDSSPRSFEPVLEPAIVCRGLAKRFHAFEHRPESLRELFIRLWRRERIARAEAYFSIRDIDLSIHRGEAVALLGANGSGKSTILRLIADVYPPSAGEIRTHGRIAAVIALGAGFHPELTGRANIALYATILGLRRHEVDAAMGDIVAFAEIGHFLDTPVKYYSSGMQARLAFAIAVNVAPDILLLDEVLAVGDAAFQERCLAKLRAFRDAGKTLVVVSHDFDTLTGLCERAVWLQDGHIRMSGPIDEIVERYRAASAAEFA